MSYIDKLIQIKTRYKYIIFLDRVIIITWITYVFQIKNIIKKSYIINKIDAKVKDQSIKNHKL